MSERERMELWYDLERNQEHMQMDGRRYVANGTLFRTCEAQQREIDNLKEDNKKLRELVRDMWDVALHPQLFGDGSYLLRRMCNLGIEVDG